MEDPKDVVVEMTSSSSMVGEMERREVPWGCVFIPTVL